MSSQVNVKLICQRCKYDKKIIVRVNPTLGVPPSLSPEEELNSNFGYTRPFSYNCSNCNKKWELGSDYLVSEVEHEVRDNPRIWQDDGYVTIHIY